MLAPHLPGEALRAAPARVEAEIDFGLAEFGGLGGEGQVAGLDDLRATPQRVTVDRGDDRLA